MIKLLLFKIIFLTFFQIIKTFYATLKVYVDDYIDSIRVDYNSITDGDDLINRKIKSIEKNFEIDYDSKIEIQISNYKEHFGLSAKLSFNNGIKEEIYSTNDIWLWSINDTRGFTEIYEYTKTSISESNIIGSYDQRIENCERCYTYLYTLIITGIVRCYNINAIKVKVGEERGINLPDLISSKAEKKSDIYFKIISDFKGKIYGENGEEIKKNIEYPVQILKYTTEKLNNGSVNVKNSSSKNIQNKKTNNKDCIKPKIYYTSSIGSDEVGTGDYFGPIVVTAAYVPKDKIEFLESIGVKDSKKLNPLNNKPNTQGPIIIPVIKYPVTFGNFILCISLDDSKAIRLTKAKYKKVFIE